MNKKLFILIFAMMLFGITASAENVGDIIGQVIPADINTYINNQPIPAYNTGGETAVRIADLANYGFNVEFVNGVSCADYRPDKEVIPIDTTIEIDIPVLYSDIEVQINGVPVPSYNIGGYMAVPIEKVCEVYLETNKENEYSEYSINYIWDEIDRKLYLDVSNDRVSYQDFMIDLIKASHMDFGSTFYNNYVKDESVENPNEPYLEKFTDIHGTKLEEYINLIVEADLIDAYAYENGDRLYPYRGVTRTDAAFLISRILGCPYDGESFFKRFEDDFKYYNNEYKENDYLKYLPDLSTYDIDCYDNNKIPDWTKPYFKYLTELNVLSVDENKYILPFQFLSKSDENELLDLMMDYMEEGVSDDEIKLMQYEYCTYNEDEGKYVLRNELLS